MQARYQVDRELCDRVRDAIGPANRVDRFVIPPFSGRAFRVNRGQAFRVIQEEGPQVGVVAFWSAHNPREIYGPIRNRTWEGVFIGVYTKMWSEPPWLRPMMTCMEDTVVNEPPDGDFHHHRFWTHCSAETMEMRSGLTGLNSCHENLSRAVEPFGLKPEDIHENINVFQKVRLDPGDGKFYAARSDSKKGDYIGFYAEIDLLVAVSVCPVGDNTREWSMPGDPGVLPLGIEVFDTKIQPNESPEWTDWRPTWKGKWVPPEG